MSADNKNEPDIVTDSFSNKYTYLLADTPLKLIEAEIRWCRDNPGTSGKGADYESAFIDGLRQAAHLLKELKKTGAQL